MGMKDVAMLVVYWPAELTTGWTDCICAFFPHLLRYPLPLLAPVGGDGVEHVVICQQPDTIVVIELVNLTSRINM